MRTARSALALAACLAAAPLVVAAPDLSDKEAKELEKQIGEQAGAGSWNRVAELMADLARANDKKTWTFLVKVAERAPETSDCATALRGCAQAMGDKKVQEEVKKTALRSPSAAVRRQLILHVAAQRDWPALIDALKDKDEQVAAVAAWNLVDAKVEAAVEPLIATMEKLDRSHDGIWDVCRNGLAKLLGQRFESAVEYRSRWEVVKAQGGLAAVKPEAERPEVAPPAGEMKSAVRLFGRPMECTRVVFILDVSGSMLAVDPGQEEEQPEGSQVRPGTPGSTTEGQPKGKNRLQRAQVELKRLINALPESVKINIVAYSSRVQMWRAEDGDKPPQLHAMTASNKKDACEFVDSFTANGVTVTDDALVRGYTVEGARCFYLLSDGAATHDGTTIVPTETILRCVDEYGKDRHITVHTLGFQGADREMMQALAKHTGGKYSDIK
jgi:hypothetical protein